MIKHGSKAIYLAGFLFSINLALTSYVNSSFLKLFVNENYVGIIYAVASVLTIVGLLEMPRLMSKYGNKNASLFSLVVSFVSLLVIAFSTKQVLVLPAFILYFVTSNIFIANLDVFIEESSGDRNVGKIRGFYLMIINAAWVVAQMVSGSIIEKSSFGGIYLFSAGLMALTAITLVLFFGKFKDPVYRKISLLKTIRFFRKDRDISKIYFINLILKFFYAWMVIYTPMYLNEYMHFSWDTIGIIFTIMLLPFVILDFPLGRLSDKIGEKKMLILGFIISAFFTILFAVTRTHDWVSIALILFGTRVGAATIEAMSEIYFFKIVTSDKSDEISFFRNTSPLSYLLAPLIAIPILIYIPSFEFIFFILGGILLVGLFLSLRINDLR